MAKRKRDIASASSDLSRKRTKGRSSKSSPPFSSHPHGGTFDYEREYKIKSILNESATRYLIDWEDDDLTGQIYVPTWEPKENANKEAVADWQKQARNKRKSATRPTKPKPVRSVSRTSQLPLEKAPSVPVSKKAARLKRRTVESSPPTPPSGTRAALPAIVESQQTTSDSSEPLNHLDAHFNLNDSITNSELPENDPAIVHVDEPPSSYLAGDYQKFSLSSQFTPGSADPTGVSIVGSSAGKPTHTSPNQTLPLETVKDFVTESSAPGNPVDQRRSALVDVNSSLENVIPDSQAVFEPSGLLNTSLKSSLPTQKQGDVLPVSAALQPQERAPSQALPPPPILVDVEKAVKRVSEPRELGIDKNIISVRKLSHSTTIGSITGDSQTRISPDILTHIPQTSLTNEQDQEVPHLAHGVVFDSNSVVGEKATSFTRRPRGDFAIASPIESFPNKDQPRSLHEEQEPGNNSTPYLGSRVTSRTPSEERISPILNGQTHSLHSPRLDTQGASFADFNRGVSSSLPSQRSAIEFSSPLASIPPRPIRTPGGVAAHLEPPTSPLMSFDTPSPRSVMDPSDVYPITASLRAQLKVIRDRHTAVRNSTPSFGSSPASQPRDVPSSRLRDSQGVLPSSQHLRSSGLLHRFEDNRRSPSTIPAMEPLPIITQEEMNTSERYETLVPQAHSDGSSSKQSIEPSAVPRTAWQQQMNGEGRDLQNVYTVPITLVGHQRDQYPQMVYFHRDLIQRFLDSEDPSAELTAEAECFVERMRRITLHPDLDNTETLTQYAVNTSQRIQWDIDCSAKCRFLKELFENLWYAPMHIVVVVPPGRMVNIVEAFLTGIRVQCRRPSDSDSEITQNDHGGPTVTLVSTDEVWQDLTSAPPEAVVSLDPTLTRDHTCMKGLLQNDEEHSRLIALVVPNSVEHIDRSLASGLARQTRLRALVSGIFQYRNISGKLEQEEPPSGTAAERLARFLCQKESDKDWPFMDLDILDDLDTQTQSETTEGTVGGKSTDAIPHGGKRHLSSDESSTPMAASKKLRTQLAVSDEVAKATTVDPESIKVTHISDSIGGPTQSGHEKTDVRPNASGPSASGPSMREQHLQALLHQAQTRAQEYLEALSDLQYRHEEQREKLIAVTNERDAAILTAQQAVTRMTEQANALTKAKAEGTELKRQMNEANERLSSHTVPERAELEALRQAAARTQVEKEAVASRVEVLKRDLEYAQQMYQSSSSSAQALAAQNTELENQLSAAQSRASGEHARLRQMGHDAHSRNVQNDNKRLRALVKNREAGMKFRDEEIARLKEASRGRMGTRGSSIPRSPRLGSPMKAIDGMPKGRGSRQGSPAAADLRGRAGSNLRPLRNG